MASGAGVASIDRRFLFDDVDHPLWMWDRVADAGVYFELDCIGNVRRLRGGARYGAGAPLPSDLGGYRFSGFGRGLAADAGTPAPLVDGVSFAQPLRWQGRWFDTATGIYDVRNRQWAPELGAFLSPDEFEYFGQQGTLWSWPRSNPLRFGDPSGRSTFGRAVAGGLGAFLGAEVGFSVGGGSGLLVGLAEGGVPAVGTAPAGAVAGAVEGALLGGALGIAIYDLSETFLDGASAAASASASLAVPVPSLDVTGKVHGDLPDHVPDGWTAEQLREAADDLRASIRRRKQEQLDLGEDAAHRERIRQEERLLKQIEKVLGGKCE